MRTIAVTLVALALLVAALYWVVPGVGRHASLIPGKIENAVDRASSTLDLVEIHRRNIEKHTRDLREKFLQIHQATVEADRLRAENSACKETLAKEERILKVSQELLSKHKQGEMIPIGGHLYSWDQLNDETLKRVDACQFLRARLQSNDQSVSELDKAYADGLAAIRQSQESLEKEKRELNVLAVKIKVAEERERVRELIQNIPTVGSVETELGKTKRPLLKRKQDLEARLVFDREVAGRSTEITTWDKELGIAKEKGSDAVQAYFQEQEKPQGTSVSATLPNVSQALEKLTSAPQTAK